MGPSRSLKDAFEGIQLSFSGSENINISIADITDEQFAEMNADMIVGGFPCQDHSVARKRTNKGIEGTRLSFSGEIIRATRIIRPRFSYFNVDRLLKAPSNNVVGLYIMLTAFNQSWIFVEWRVINAADYGRSQRRRRVFFFMSK